MLYHLIGNQSGCYQLLLLSVWLLPTTVWLLPWWSPIATTGNYQQKTSMKLGKKPQRFIKENFCSILEYILSDHFTIRSIKMKIHTCPNSVSTYLTPMNQLLHSQTGMKMYVQELSLSFIISNLPKIRIPYIQKSIECNAILFSWNQQPPWQVVCSHFLHLKYILFTKIWNEMIKYLKLK